jgi:ATP-dependent DNA ligase I
MKLRRAIPRLLIPVLSACGAGGAVASRPAAQPTAEALRLFDYDASAPLGVRVGSTRQSGGLTVQEITYASPKGGRVPATLLIPEGRGPFAGILFMHGMPGNRTATFPEAETLARRGAVTLSIDAPFARRRGEAALELKLDGARVQVHKAGGEVRVYSRRGNDVTVAVPDLVETIQALPAGELVLDGETIALRPDGSPLPFQVTMRRFGRKLDVARLRAELPLTSFFFDLLHLDGEDLIDHPGGERFAALAAAAPGLTVPRLVTADEEAADAFFAEALARGHEGLMAKAPDAPYEAGRRGASWLKIKPAHTLDLVVLAAEWGHGRRQGWLSNLHLGARDPENGGFVMLGKTFKGMTDETLAWQTARLQELSLGTDGWTVYVRPELVVEIAFSDVQESPQYPGGMALRFARVKRYRGDKTAAEADTIEAVRRIFAVGQGAIVS